MAAKLLCECASMQRLSCLNFPGGCATAPLGPHPPRGERCSPCLQSRRGDGLMPLPVEDGLFSASSMHTLVANLP